MRPFVLLSPFLLATNLLHAQGQPNDDCATAQTIGCGQTIVGSTTGAFPDEAFTCGTTITAPGVWYMLPGSNATITVSTCTENSYDTKINVYQGNCGVITCVGGNDDSAGCGLGSSVTFTGNGGTTYYILVQGYNNATGTFELTVDCLILSNDDCSGAIPITCGDTIPGTTVGAFPDEAFECGTTITAPGVWYTASGISGVAEVTTCGSPGHDAKINVYSGACGVIECVAGNDDTPGQGNCATVTWVADPDATYQILVQGFNGATGNFSLSLSCSTCPPPFDVQVTALDTTASVAWGSWNTGALYVLEYGPAGFLPGTGTYVAGVVGADGPPVGIGGLEVDSSYEVYLHEMCGMEQSDTLGPVAFSTLPVLLAPNSSCAGALPITCGEALSGNTTQGLLTPGPTCASANITTKGLWYALTGNGDVITLSTCGQTSYDSKISVFTGTCGELACVAGNDDAPGCGGNSSLLSFPSQPGVDYLVLVHGFNQAQGLYTLTMSCAPSCSPVAENDDCPNATTMLLSAPGGCEAITGTNACAFAPALPNPPCVPYAPIVDVWYMFNSGNASQLTLLLEATTASVVHAAVYTTCGNDPYITCWTDVQGPIDLTGLAPWTDHYLRVWNGGGAQAGAFTVCVEGDLSTAIAGGGGSATIALRPVPANEVVHVDGLPGPMDLRVTDPTGRTMLTGRASHAGTHSLHIGDLSPGIYLLRNDRDGSLLGRFIRE